jgi:hypothetical protein
VPLALGLGLALALGSYFGWLSSDLEREREEARQARERYERELEEKSRIWAAATEQPTATASASAPAAPLSTSSCKEAHERFGSDAGPPRIDPELERKVKNRLSYGTYLRDCHVPARTKILICATIVRGVAEGVTVKLTPEDEDEAGCIDRSIRRMSFPHADVAVVATTRFQ